MSKKLINMLRIKSAMMALSVITLASCTSKSEQKTEAEKPNPFLSEYTTPFQVPPFDQIKNEHYMPAFEAGIKEQQAEIENIVNSAETPSFANTILPFDKSGQTLDRVSNVFFNLNECLTNDEMNAIAEQVLPVILPELAQRGVVIHADEHAYAIAQQLIDQGVSMQLVPATKDDWATEYLNLDIAVRCMSGLDAAIEHVNRFGTRHSECIVTEDEAAAEEFLASIDAAAVYWNASTRFTDGGEFGLGAEIGISTQKLHARGPFALAALTTYKYLLRGSGQVRS